jgi:putative redox protein
MEVRIRHGHGKQSEAFTACHRIISDQAVSEGGTDTGMTPPEIMLSALGCCAMHYAAEFLHARKLSPDDMELRISAQKGGLPARLVEIGIEVDAPGLSRRVRDGLLKAIQACLLHRTLLDPPRVKVTMTTSVEEGPAEPVRLAS